FLSFLGNVRLFVLAPFPRCGVCLLRAEAVGPSGTPVRIVRPFGLPSAAPGSTANARNRHTPHRRNCVGADKPPSCEARVWRLLPKKNTTLQMTTSKGVMRGSILGDVRASRAPCYFRGGKLATV